MWIFNFSLEFTYRSDQEDKATKTEEMDSFNYVR